MRADLDRFRRELGTDYIDILLLHCMMDDDWPDRKKGAMAVISEAQEKGIRAHAWHFLPHPGRSQGRCAKSVGGSGPGAHQSGAGADGFRPRTVISVLKQMKAAGKASSG